MKKLKLDLDTVKVQSFTTDTATQALWGTVHAEGITLSRCGSTCIVSCCHTDDVVPA